MTKSLPFREHIAHTWFCHRVSSQCACCSALFALSHTNRLEQRGNNFNSYMKHSFFSFFSLPFQFPFFFVQSLLVSSIRCHNKQQHLQLKDSLEFRFYLIFERIVFIFRRNSMLRLHTCTLQSATYSSQFSVENVIFEFFVCHFVRAWSWHPSTSINSQIECRTVLKYVSAFSFILLFFASSSSTYSSSSVLQTCGMNEGKKMKYKTNEKNKSKLTNIT